MNKYNVLMNNLDELQMHRFKDNLDREIDQISSGNQTVVDALYNLTEL